jgi:hypothetical protein
MQATYIAEGMDARMARRRRITETVCDASEHLASYRGMMDLLHVLCKSGIGARWHISHVSPVFSSIPRATKKHKLSITANVQAQKWIRFILHVADAQTFEAFAGDIKPYKK